MDLSKVDMQILSVSGQLPYFAKENDAVDAARLGNDIYARIVREYPKRFAAFACTPLPHVQASIEETRRALDELGMVGVTAGTVVLGKSIADPAFDGFFAELNRRKAVLFIHPTGGSLGSQLIESTNLVWPVGAPLEDTVCLLQFMQANFPVPISGHQDHPAAPRRIRSLSGSSARPIAGSFPASLSHGAQRPGKIFLV